MSLIICPECSNKVSQEAKNCPYCGYPFSKYVAKEKRIQSLSNIRKSITSNRKKY